jgi:hypothetical protein
MRTELTLNGKTSRTKEVSHRAASVDGSARASEASYRTASVDGSTRKYNLTLGEDILSMLFVHTHCLVKDSFPPLPPHLSLVLFSINKVTSLVDQ